MPYTTNARIPFRPLSYDNRDQAKEKEIIVDYTSGLIYVKTIDGRLVDLTSTITNIVINNITTNPDYTLTGDSITVVIDGVDYNVQEALVNILNEIEIIRNSLGGIVDPETGNITFNIDASQIHLDAEHRFVTDAEKAKWNAKANVYNMNAVILGGVANWAGSAAPYTQSISLANILESDTPIVDINLDCTYADASTRMDNFANVYRIRTLNGQLQAFSSKITEVDLPIIVKVDRSN